MAPILGGFFRKLTGGGADGGIEAVRTSGPAVAYKDYEIFFTPRKSGAQWLTAGLIVKETAEGRREHAFIRAETHPSEDGARDFALIKARQIIDEQGERLFKAPEARADEPDA